jgi:hypothetical protein
LADFTGDVANSSPGIKIWEGWTDRRGVEGAEVLLNGRITCCEPREVGDVVGAASVPTDSFTVREAADAGGMGS